MSFGKYILVAALAVTFSAAGALGETIRLQAKVAVMPRQDVRLGDIATISGGSAQQNEKLSNMVIISDIEHAQSVKAESVLMAVMAQRGVSGVGSLQVSGAAECEIDLTTGGAIAATPPAAATPAPAAPAVTAGVARPSPKPAASVSTAAAAPAPAAAPAATAAAAPTDGSLRQTLLAMLKKAINQPEGDYEITIDSSSQMLDKPVPASQEWLCRPTSKTLLGSVEIDAQLVENNRIVQKLNVAATVWRKQMVVILTRKFSRGDIVTSDGVRLEAEMLDRKWPGLFDSVASVVGLEAQQDVEIGEKADERGFKPSLMAHKGQLVTIVYVAGPLQAETSGRAMADAERNDRIQIRNDGTGDVFSAVMIGRGVGVAGGTLTPAQEKKILEAFE